MRMRTRKDYLSGECTHREYYGQFVTEETLNHIARAFSVSRLAATQDQEHFNSISLYRWDEVCHTMPFDKKLHQTADPGGVSLSDKVCIAKEAAKQLVEKSRRQSNE